MRAFLDITTSLITFSGSNRQKEEARLLWLCQVKGRLMGLNKHGTSYGTNMVAFPLVPAQPQPRSHMKRRDTGNEVDPASARKLEVVMRKKEIVVDS